MPEKLRPDASMIEILRWVQAREGTIISEEDIPQFPQIIKAALMFKEQLAYQKVDGGWLITVTEEGKEMVALRQLKIASERRMRFL